jgi:hypothetical protein
MKASLYELSVEFVESRGAIDSNDHEEVMRRHSLDGNPTLACLVALRAVKTD